MTPDDIARLLRNGRRYAGLDVREAAKVHGTTQRRVRTYEAGHGLTYAAEALSMLERYGLRIVVHQENSRKAYRNSDEG